MSLDNSAKISDIITILQDIQGINQKEELINVIGSPAISEDDMTTLINKIQTEKNMMAINLTNKGQNSVGTESLSSLVTKLNNITLGKKWASGSGSQSGNQQLVISGLDFKPDTVLVNTGGYYYFFSISMNVAQYSFGAYHYCYSAIQNYQTNDKAFSIQGKFGIMTVSNNFSYDWIAFE